VQPPSDSLPDAYFERLDPSDDAAFYDQARLVVHIDRGAIEALGEAYAELLPRGGTLLDLMSSWRSHLPPALAEAEGLSVVGLGMNDEEMEENPRLARHVWHDLNREPGLPFPDAAFDGAMCAVSIQYLTHPLEVFSEVARVLKPGAPFVVSFSNRCFPTKAVAIWHNTTDQQHIQLVGRYFNGSGSWTEPRARAFQPANGDPLYVVWAERL
jgi:SAM-dependent methyltransferase